MVTGVRDSAGQDFQINMAAQCPFQESHSIVRGPSTAQTQFDFSCTANSGDFLIQAAHHVVGVDPSFLRSVSAGAIYFSSDAELLFTIDGAYNYYLAGSSMGTNAGVSVSTLDPYKELFLEGGSDDSYSHVPAFGSFTIQGQVLLPAGRTYELYYDMEVQAEGLSGATGDGSGFIHFTLQPIAEPGALLPLALGALTLRKRRSRP